MKTFKLEKQNKPKENKGKKMLKMGADNRDKSKD